MSNVERQMYKSADQSEAEQDDDVVLTTRGGYVKATQETEEQKEQQDIVRVSENYAEGGLVDRRPKEGKSPPNAGVADDLPRNLSEGEYVIPKHIVDHFGEKFFEDLLDTIPPPEETRVQLKF